MPICNNTLIMYDLETTSANPQTTQIIEIAAIAIDPRKLEIIPNSEFYSLIKPIEDPEEQAKLGLGPIEQGALDVNKKTMEELRLAPALKTVWKSFEQYIMNYNTTGKKWTAPALCGFNNNGFDDIILNRVAGTVWKYGPWDEERQQCPLFHPTYNLDLMKLLYPWFESNYDVQNFKMDTFRKFFGLSSEGAHTADQDVKDQAEILIRLLRLTRKYSKITNWTK
jgi:DNA polymerase III alpha subunit (gram-positive type)